VTGSYHDFGHQAKGVIALKFTDTRNTKVPKHLGPRPQLRVTSGKVKGESKIRYPFSGFRRLKESEELTSGIAES
jgi:hypothetical protein